MPPKDVFRPKARRPRGFQDRRGPGLAAERALIAKISAVYEAWGFEPLETGAFEYADALGKFLPDQDRPNEGVFSLEDDDKQWVSLRYDLTAPLARFVAENFDALPKPYRRWAAGPVWRNEKPGPGRFREFWQCDADTVGAPGPAADAEMIAMACAALEAAGVARGDYVIKYSSRHLLDGVLEVAGVASDRRGTVLRAIDKFDRLQESGVRALLGAGRKDESGAFTKGAELNTAQVDQIIRFVTASSFLPNADDFLGLWNFVSPNVQILPDTPGDVGIVEVTTIANLLKQMNLLDCVRLDTSIVRGLDYYTGTVFEAELRLETTDESGNKISFGSVGGGGRYDDLVSRFRGEKIPATGFSIGVSRLAAALEAAKRSNAEADGPVVVLPFDREAMAECFALAGALRDNGLRAEVYLGGSGPKAQLRYADKRKAPVAVILGEDERKAGQVTLKDLKLGAELSKTVADNKEWREGQQAQETIAQSELVASVRKILAGQS